MDDLTLFALPDPVPAEAPAPDPRPKQLRTMQDRHGIAEEGRSCGACAHLVRGQYNTGVYFKCDQFLPWTHGPGTDFRKYWRGCGLWAERTQEERG